MFSPSIILYVLLNKYLFIHYTGEVAFLGDFTFLLTSYIQYDILVVQADLNYQSVVVRYAWSPLVFLRAGLDTCGINETPAPVV